LRNDKIMRSILSKLFSLNLVITIAFLCTILYISFNQLKQSTIANLNNQIDNQNSIMIAQAKDYLFHSNYSELDSIIKIIANQTTNRLTIILPDGNVVADSDVDPNKMENHADRPEIIDATKNQHGQSLRYSYSVNQQMLNNARPIIHNNEIIGYSRISVPISYIDDLFSDIIRNIILTVVIVLIISLGLFYVSSRRISKNIGKLVIASNKISDGDFSSKVYLNSRDELSVLGNNFNEMADKLRESFNEINLKQEEITSIIKSIKDSIVVIDSNNRISLYNDNFKDNFKINITNNNKYYWELIRDLNFQKLVKKIQSNNESRKEEIHYNDKFFLASGSWNSLKKEVVIILYDISQLKKLEEIKRDFIINISHELKTPLTAIKGFIETLLEDSKDENKYYLEIISRQTQRLILIVQDLLLLSKVEQPNIKLQKTDFSLNKMLDSLFVIFDTTAKSKNIELILNLDENSLIHADEFMFEQILINLIENAIRMTDRGYVRISLHYEDSKPVITVEDSGSGIASEHIPRIFERFYTVNKSHARTLSGTGLGLSIVKHIVNLHGGTISVKSEMGKGSSFIIKL